MLLPWKRRHDQRSQDQWIRRISWMRLTTCKCKLCFKFSLFKQKSEFYRNNGLLLTVWWHHDKHSCRPILRSCPDRQRQTLQLDLLIPWPRRISSDLRLYWSRVSTSYNFDSCQMSIFWQLIRTNDNFWRSFKAINRPGQKLHWPLFALYKGAL